MKPIRIDDPVCWSPRVKDTRQSMRFVPSAINGFGLTVILVDNPDAGRACHVPSSPSGLFGNAARSVNDVSRVRVRR